MADKENENLEVTTEEVVEVENTVSEDSSTQELP
jgi:hypothetical protein